MNFFSPGQVRVKICGITNEEDAWMCISAGADALGFNFYSGSKRYVEPDKVLPWIRQLSSKVDRVAVVVNPDENLILKLRDAGCFEIIQFHGDESPSFCDMAGFGHWIKAIRVRDENVLRGALTYNTPNLLLDSWIPHAYGGTGRRLNWNMVREFVHATSQRRFILAGGLNIQNVRHAVEIVQPHAVDVAGGVELNSGRKEEYLVKEFINAIRS